MCAECGRESEARVEAMAMGELEKEARSCVEWLKNSAKKDECRGFLALLERFLVGARSEGDGQGELETEPCSHDFYDHIDEVLPGIRDPLLFLHDYFLQKCSLCGALPSLQSLVDAAILLAAYVRCAV